MSIYKAVGLFGLFETLIAFTKKAQMAFLTGIFIVLLQMVRYSIERKILGRDRTLPHDKLVKSGLRTLKSLA